MNLIFIAQDEGDRRVCEMGTNPPQPFSELHMRKLWRMWGRSVSCSAPSQLGLFGAPSWTNLFEQHIPLEDTLGNFLLTHGL